MLRGRIKKNLSRTELPDHPSSEGDPPEECILHSPPPLFKLGVFCQTGLITGFLYFGQDISGNRKIAEFVGITCGNGNYLHIMDPDFIFL